MSRLTELYATAAALAEDGRWEEALAAYDAVLAVAEDDGYRDEDAPTVVDAWYGCCRVLSEALDRREEALSTAREALARLADVTAPDAVEGIARIMYSLGTDLAALGRHDESGDVLAALVERYGGSEDPDVAALVRSGRDGQAHALRSRCLGSAGPTTSPPTPTRRSTTTSRASAGRCTTRR